MILKWNVAHEHIEILNYSFVVLILVYCRTWLLDQSHVNNFRYFIKNDFPFELKSKPIITDGGRSKRTLNLSLNFLITSTFLKRQFSMLISSCRQTLKPCLLLNLTMDKKVKLILKIYSVAAEWEALIAKTLY